MNSIMIFENPEFGRVRSMKDEKGEVWFVGSDIAKALGYTNPAKAIRDHVDDEDMKYEMIEATEQNVRLLNKSKSHIVNESGLYSLILSSKLESAKRFKHWVTSVVLPQIRRTGGYIPVSDGDTADDITARTIDILKRTIAHKDVLLEKKNILLKAKDSLLEVKDEQLAAQAPDVMFAQAISAADNDILVRDLAKLITENGYPIGQQRLFFWLRQHHYLFQHENRPRQEWVERGLFRISASLIETHYGNLEHLTTHVTGKGQQYFIDGFKSGRFVA